MSNAARLIRRMEWPHGAAEAAESLLAREWLVTNGLGGYASGTVSGAVTRRYHGLLVAALPAPLGRVVMLSHVAEQLRLPGGEVVRLWSDQRLGGPAELHGADHLTEFRLEGGLPFWRYQLGDVVIEKHCFMLHQQNTVHLQYRLVRGDGPIELEVRPSMHFRHHEAPVNDPLAEHYTLSVVDDQYEISADGGEPYPPLRLLFHGHRAAFTVAHERKREVLYPVEESRGYEAAGDLWSPGWFHADLTTQLEVALVASTESWRTIRALSPAEAAAAELERRDRLLRAADVQAREGPAAELVLAADQFIIVPVGRVKDAARAHARGDEVRTVIAGYHWFTDWGRDTMISLEGLTLITGRDDEAGYILRTFAGYIRDGLIPNMFPEADTEGLYHTADATLWFFHAVDRYVEATGDATTLALLTPVLAEIVERHLSGTRFGIHVDPEDGLLRQGAEGYQLTWMDAKVGDWVVTPRRGKAVEINALWYNALCLLASWLRQEHPSQAETLERHAARVRVSFNDRFWFSEGGYLYDVVDGEAGDDSACRPNQLLAISLRHAVLESNRWERVLRVVRERLLTPVGLRSLAPGHGDYKPRYYGDLRARDAAYHQGTVWAWLIGPFIDAWLRVHPDDCEGARELLRGFLPHLDEACVGSVSEIFDAEKPYAARGCIAQAWSVAELLRAWVRTGSRAAASAGSAPSTVRGRRRAPRAISAARS